MVGLLYAMAFMVLLLVGWVVWNNKPLPLFHVSNGVRQGGAGAARLDGLPGCSPPWKMWGKRFRQTAKLALSLDSVTKISQHNHFRYFRHHFGSTFSRNPTKPMFRCFPTTPLMRWRFQHTCRGIWRFRGCLRHSPKGKKPNNWLQKTWWYIRLSQCVFDILTMNF